MDCCGENKDNHKSAGKESGADRVRSRGRLVLIGFLLVAGFYLVTEHTAHALGALPYLILLACPLMHLFIHHGHGDHSVHSPTRTTPLSADDLVAESAEKQS